MSSETSSLLPEFIGDSYALRLGLALALAVIVVIAVGAAVSVQASDELESDVESDLRATSATQADQIDAWLGSARQSVRMTSALPVFESGSTSEVQAQLNTLQDNDRLPADVVAVHYVDTTTMEIEASSNEDFVGVDASEQGAPFATDPPNFEGPDDTHVTDPFQVSVVDHPIIAILSPVEGDSDHAIVFMTDLKERTEAFSDQREGSYTAVVNDEGQYIAHPNSSKINTPHDGSMTMPASGESGFMAMGDTLMGMTTLETADWTVMVHSDRSEAYALSSQINSDLIGIVLFAVINLGLVGVTIGSGTIVSLRRLSNRAEEMGAGDLDVDLTTARTDEIGSLYQSLDDMRTNLRETISDAEEARREAEQAKSDAEQAREDAEEEQAEMEALTGHLELKATEYSDALSSAADGDLTVRVDTESMNDAMSEVGEEINAMLADLSTTIAEMKSFASNVLQASDDVGTNAQRVDRASQQVSESIQEIFDGTNEQSERLQNAASEMENLSAASEEMAASAQQVADTSQSAAEVGEDGRRAAQEAIEEMNSIEAETEETVAEINALDEDLDEIGEIVSVITQIVEQTNMLALNASIEAAHADAEGAGFAVVADEIKGLAEETKEAAGDIEERIERIQSQAGDTVETMEATSQRITDGVETVEEAVNALETIVEYTEEVDSGIQEIDRATEEQAETATELLEMIDTLTEISQETATEADTVAGAAEDQAHSIGEVSDSATELRQRADELEQALDRFSVQSAESPGQQTTAATDDD